MASISLAISGIIGKAGSLLSQAQQFTAYRPPQWLMPGAPAVTITATDPQTGETTAYVFDGIIRAEHEQHAVITLNPVQNGAPTSDHMYVAPARLTLEIAMSDAMQSFAVGQWGDASSRSVSAYQTLVALQAARAPIQIATRIRQYDTMLISDISVEDDSTTKHALNALVTFTEVLTSLVENVTSGFSTGQFSEIPQTTSQTMVGQTQPQTVPASMQAQNQVPSDLSTLGIPAAPDVPNPGSWSSYNTSSLSQVIP